MTLTELMQAPQYSLPQEQKSRWLVEQMKLLPLTIARIAPAMTGWSGSSVTLRPPRHRSLRFLMFR